MQVPVTGFQRLSRLAAPLVTLLLSSCLPAAQDGASHSGHDAPLPPERNIVLIVTDDHGQDTGAYGNPVIRTPHLDALAADGVRFTHAFATTASCSASRSVLLSGLHNHRNGQYGHQHDYAHFSSFENIRSLPVLLAEGGYRTAIVGKFHVAPEAVYHFQRTIDGDQRNEVQMAEQVRAFVAEQSSQPFFLYFAPSDPHRGGGTADESPLDIKPDRFGNRPEGYPGIERVTYDPADVIVPPWLPDSPESRAELAQYYQSVSRLDQGIGRLLTVLQEAGVYDQTLVVYLSDHGAAFPGAKTTVYEPGLRSPLIVRNPYAERRGLVSPAMVSWVDITPTLLDFAGVESPSYTNHIGLERLREQMSETHGLHGRSFLPILDSESPAGWDEIFASHTFHEIQMYYPMRVVRDRRFKLIWNIAFGMPYPFASDLWAAATWQAAYRQGPDTPYGLRTVRTYMLRPEFELYDIETDPWESTNLADDPRYADTLRAYQARLRSFQIRTHDPWLLKWDYP